MADIQIGNKLVGPENPCFIVAEVGINHNGSLEIAKKLIDIAAEAGCDAIKFQKRTPELCVPINQKNIMYETPWGLIPYIEYRHKVEFGEEEYKQIDSCCKEKNIIWFVSCWDEESVDFVERFDPPCYKVGSPSLTDENLLSHIRSKGKPLIVSTGGSTMEQVEKAVEILGSENLILLHCVSTYPAKLEELNLRVIQTLRRQFPDIPIGYSGHEVSLAPSVMAAVLGACLVERHITLDHTMWGSNQAASMERRGVELLVRNIRHWEMAKGNGVKRVLPSEIPNMEKLRRRNDF